MRESNFDWIDRQQEKNAENEDLLELEGTQAYGEGLGEEDLKLTARQIKRLEKAKFARIGKQNALRDMIQKTDPPGLPRPGESIHIVASKFDFWDVTPVLLEHFKKGIDTLYLATWAIAMGPARELVDTIRAGKIRRAYMITGIYMKRREPVTHAYLFENLSKTGGGLKCFGTHVKVVLVGDPKTGDFFAVESSANMTGNPNLEQFTIYNDQGVYNFHRDWIMEAYKMKSEGYMNW